MQKKVSIIVLIYRVEPFLKQCIESLRNQTYKDLEIILVDDGSDDGCPRICDQYAQIDSRIKVIHKENGGIDKARKAGISAATGYYVGYVDGDDWAEPEMYEKLVGFAEKYDVDTVESGMLDTASDRISKRIPFFPEGKYKGEVFEKEIEPFMLYSGQFYRLGIMASLCNKLFKREIITKYQMMPEPSDNIVDDTFCSIPAVAEAKSLYVSHECYYHYRVREGSVKRNVRHDFVEILLKCYPDWINRFPYAKNKDEIKKQIQYYLVYILLMKSVYIFDENNESNILVPYGRIPKQSKIIVYGAGAMGVQLHSYLLNEIKDNLVMWADKNYQAFSKESRVENPQEIMNYAFDYVVIAILWAEKAESAKADLIRMGIPNDKIRWIDQKYIDCPELLLQGIEE